MREFEIRFQDAARTAVKIEAAKFSSDGNSFVFTNEAGVWVAAFPIGAVTALFDAAAKIPKVQ